MKRRVLLDVCVPHRIRKELTGFDVQTARFAGVDQLTDGELLAAIDGRFDVLVTLDRNLAFQQKLSNWSVAVVLIRIGAQTPEAFRALIPALTAAIATSVAGAVTMIGP